MLAPFKIDLSNIRCDQHISFTSSDAISQICAPLFEKLGLNEFSHSRVYKDGSRAELWSDSRALEHTFLIKGYLVGIYSPALIGESCFSMYEYKIETYPSVLHDRYHMQLQEQKEYFDHDKCFLIAYACQDYMEYFLFYASKERNDVINTYLNNLDELESFIKYYKLCAADIIERAENQKLIPGWRDSIILSEKPSVMKINNMTAQEIRVATLLVKGESAKQISYDLLISQKTVEQHILNIKNKFNSLRRSDVVEKLYRIGIRADHIYE